jgi:hypothetical protein
VKNDKEDEMDEINITLNLGVDNVNTILAGLAELPAKTSYDLINKIKLEAEKQIVAIQDTKASEQPQLLVEN